MTEYDEQLESLSQTLSEVDGLLNDFNRELSSYMDDITLMNPYFMRQSAAWICSMV